MHTLLLSARELYSSVEQLAPEEPLEWVTGGRLSRPPASLAFQFKADATATWPDYIRPATAIPLFSVGMRAALERVPVTNIDYYPATVHNALTGESRRYFAANIIGCLAAMDRSRSTFVPARSHPVVVRSVDKLVIDESLCRQSPVFRLAEYDALIVVDRHVAACLEAARLYAVRLCAPSDWDGFLD